ncbi:MAG TPA: HDOD domain-containing protein [Bacteroidetes bacterium]|nr:HDOD domain-containing protein [Bacteroidota bacterium]
MQSSPLSRRLAISTDDLPSLDPLVAVVLEMVSDPETSPSRLAGVLAKDVGMAARVLKLSNSAYYGHPREIRRIEQAVVVLGFYEIRNLVVISATFDLVRQGENRTLMQDLWEHQLRAAVAAKVLSARLLPAESDLAYLAGLLHDVGKMVLAMRLPGEYAEIAAETENRPGRAVVRERERFEVDHQEIGGVLLDRWNFPEALAGAVRLHHGVLGAEGAAPLGRLVELADILAHAVVKEEVLEAEEEALARFAGERRPDWPAWLKEIREQYERETKAVGGP